jgi:predicted ester cyclase
MSTDTNKALVRRYYDEVLNQRNLAVLNDLLAPTFVSYLPNGVGIHRDQYEQAIRMSYAAFSDLHVTIQDQIAEDDKVATRYRAQGTIWVALPASLRRTSRSRSQRSMFIA